MSKVTFTNQINSALSSWLAASNYSKIIALVDENTSEHCLPIINADMLDHVIEIKSGEINKNIVTCQYIWDEMTKVHLDRKSLLINLGGGVIGDMGGFCAATFKRGIDFIQVPTTLLAQVDASVGGKLGIDYHELKNHIGVFQEPKNVFISTEFLDTLPEGQLRSGFAEVIKHALISDENLWKELNQKSFPEYDWSKIVERSVHLKQLVVEKDPFESGLRKILNFGHTIGHAIESIRLHSEEPLLHGEAVAHGMVIEGILANQLGLLSEQSLTELSAFINSTYGKIKLTEDEKSLILEHVLQDKKNEGGRVLMALINAAGSAKWDCEVPRTDILEALESYDCIQM